MAKFLIIPKINAPGRSSSGIGNVLSKFGNNEVGSSLAGRMAEVHELLGGAEAFGSQFGKYLFNLGS